MGCGASIMQRPDGESKILAQLGNSNGAGPNKPVRSPLTKEQINSRIVCSPKTMKSKVTAKLSAQYAFVSQRGYYPDALDKPNQDSCTILPAFMGDAAKMYFGVFDGHGTTGDLCASFVRKECPERLVRILDRKNCSFLEAYSKSFEETNARLHASRIDDSLSGTTAICMFLDGEMIHVANVGDSRAVIATMSEGKLVAQPLSVDQTPYRSDERERVKRSGARVLTMDQLEGIAPVHDNWAANLNDQVDEDGDPPRIWSPYAQEKENAADANDVSKIVYEDKPMLSRPWTSVTARESHEDVEALSVVPSRPLITMSVTKMSDELNADYKFSDRDADQCFVEWRQHKDPNYELTRLEQDVGLQGTPPLVDSTTQTSWFRSVNSALQYEPIVMEPTRRRAEMDSDKIQAFLAPMEAYFKRESERMKAARASKTGLSEGGAPSLRQNRGEDGVPPGIAAANNMSSMPGKEADSTRPAHTGADDDIFKQMESEFCRDMGLETARSA
ncbi:Peptidyl-prolyl cis-trans isomerase D [Phytophthora nicotianae]|uniref:Peptidyl-prolyl cis-trans isomerase D n=1 Tax=Phytophthora nicotianae TaxID=4792 RepID=A0A0W8DJ92_PHYNI|nr:Peptidyl-prolyl cis-trans isomerase D [Phytophthora nicotianae]